MNSSTLNPDSPKLRVLFATVGDRNTASSRVRAYWIAEELKKRGLHCTVLPQKQRTDLVKLLVAIPKYDVIIFQKAYGRYHCWLQSFARALGKQTYIDIDDAPSPKNAEHTNRRVATMMRRASGILAGSNNLVEYSKQHQPNTHLIPTAVKLSNYPLKVTNDSTDPSVVCLGWIGNGNYYTEDLIEILTEPLSRLATVHSIELKIVGACGNQKLHTAFVDIPNLKVICIDQINWSDPEAVAEQIHSFDIGLYPLLETRFNKFKCGFKALEYMACGLPVVCSKVAINDKIVNHDTNGFLATNTIDWENYLKALIVSKQKRASMGKAGRQYLELNYGTSSVARKLHNILSRKL